MGHLTSSWDIRLAVLSHMTSRKARNTAAVSSLLLPALYCSPGDGSRPAETMVETCAGSCIDTFIDYHLFIINRKPRSLRCCCWRSNCDTTDVVTASPVWYKDAMKVLPTTTMTMKTTRSTIAMQSRGSPTRYRAVSSRSGPRIRGNVALGYSKAGGRSCAVFPSAAKCQVTVTGIK